MCLPAAFLAGGLVYFRAFSGVARGIGMAMEGWIWLG
jgi:hypothetical protein